MQQFYPPHMKTHFVLSNVQRVLYLLCFCLSVANSAVYYITFMNAKDSGKFLLFQHPTKRCASTLYLFDIFNRGTFRCLILRSTVMLLHQSLRWMFHFWLAYACQVYSNAEASGAAKFTSQAIRMNTQLRFVHSLPSPCAKLFSPRIGLFVVEKHENYNYCQQPIID